jgi:hypothetical protein
MSRLRARDFPDWLERAASGPAPVAVVLLAITLALHRGALSAGWRFDDGPLLYFVTKFSPLEYFSIPEVMRQQSWASLTPWNALFYELGLPFSGLDPWGHYAHLLAIIWLTALATWFLLRLWLPGAAAFAGAALYLAMPATGAVGRMLMTGHYAYGLLFSVLSLYLFARGVREHRKGLSLAAALFYALACLCKELYPPLIAAMVLLPVGTFRERLRHLPALLLVAAGYAVLRLAVLQGVNTYARTPLDGALSAHEIGAQFLAALFGSGWHGAVGIGAALLALLAALLRPRQRIAWGFAIVFLMVAVLPILGMARMGFADLTASRLLYLLGWGLAVGLAWSLGRGRAFTVLLAVPAVALALGQRGTTSHIDAAARPLEAQYGFVAESRPGAFLLPPGFAYVGYLESMRDASLRLGRSEQPVVLKTEEALEGVDGDPGSRVFRWDAECGCVAPMGAAYQAFLGEHRGLLEAGVGRRLGLTVEIEDQGVRKLLRWKFVSEHPGGFELHLIEYMRYAVPAEGEIPFGLDVTAPRNAELRLRVQQRSPEGWLARSPVLTIHPGRASRVEWAGASAGE